MNRSILRTMNYKKTAFLYLKFVITLKAAAGP